MLEQDVAVVPRMEGDMILDLDFIVSRAFMVPPYTLVDELIFAFI
jgi:hypothetical protein